MIYTQLLKIYLKNTFSKGTFGNTKVKRIAFIGLMIYAAVVIIGSTGYLFYTLGEALASVGQIGLMISFLGVYSLIMPLVLTLFRASGTLFFYKDFSIVGPLPIKSSTVFLAKLTVLMLWIYASALVFALPITFSYFYFAGFDIVSFLVILVGFFTLPLVPVLLMSLISLLIGYISTKTRFSIIIQTVFTLGLIFGVMFLQFGMSSSENPLADQVSLMTLISDYYPPFKWFSNAVVNHQVLDLVYLVLFNLVIFFGGVFGFEKLSLKLNKTTIKKKISNNKAVNIQAQPLMVTLVKKEFNKFFSIPLYMINCGFGLIFILIGAIASVFFKEDVMFYVSQFGFDIKIGLVAIYSFMIVLTYTPAVNLSLEGKNFWVLKSLPIKPQEIMLSKVLFNIVLIVPISLISLFVVAFAFNLGLVDVLLLTLYIIVLVLFSSHLQGAINLFFPKFDFETETIVIKQSVSAMLATFSGIAIVASNVGLFVLLGDYLNVELTMLLITLVNALLGAICAWLLYSNAQKQFKKY